MLYHSRIVDLRTGISLMVVLLVSFPLQCGNVAFPHGGILRIEFSLAQVDAILHEWPKATSDRITSTSAKENSILRIPPCGRGIP